MPKKRSEVEILADALLADAAGGADTGENHVTRKFRAEPAPQTVQELALRRMHVVLDSRLPLVELTVKLGVRCSKLIESCYEFHRCCGSFLGEAPPVLRALLSAVLTHALTHGPAADTDDDDDRRSLDSLVDEKGRPK